MSASTQSSPRKQTRKGDENQELDKSSVKKPVTPNKSATAIFLDSLNLSGDFQNQSWADMVEEEQNRSMNKTTSTRVIKSPRKRRNLTPKKEIDFDLETINSPLKSPSKRLNFTPEKDQNVLLTQAEKSLKSPRKRLNLTPIKEQKLNFEIEIKNCPNGSSLIDYPPLGQEECSSAKKSRKAVAPIKAESQPKFSKSLALTEALANRRIVRLEAEKKKHSEKNDNSFLSRHAGQHTSNLRKRNISGDSMMTADSVTSKQESRVKCIPNKSAKINPLEGKILTPNPPKEWDEPKNGWCTDEAIILRRTKEIQKAQERDVYKRYVSEVAKHNRKKNVDPKTPNKYLNFSRRSWDQQIRKWKIKLYEWAGETPSPSTHTSYCQSEVDETENYERKIDTEVLKKKLEEQGVIENLNPESVFSMLGHWDMDSRRGFDKDDESTLKGVPDKCGEKGPIDFTEFHS